MVAAAFASSTGLVKLRLKRKLKGYTPMALPSKAATNAHDTNANEKCPLCIPQTESPSSRKMQISAKKANKLKSMRAYSLVSSDTLGSIYLRAKIPVKKIVIIPLNSNSSANIKGI
mmetsp:Transcript_21468/g.53240  ORF Transcript_21468/g.53240 Transcript_21468/m.53240 type:complete len:116 (-) Transcript_21468:861-1208(-)